uniref:Uncharacterized protein n=1 Tax=Oryza meridionalis TaxID=40149 RepID=A0A0E0F1X0_9ORYZ
MGKEKSSPIFFTTTNRKKGRRGGCGWWSAGEESGRQQAGSTGGFVGSIAFQAFGDELHDACELIGPVRSLCLAVNPGTLRGRELHLSLADRPNSRLRDDGGHCEPVGMKNAVHVVSLVLFGRPLESTTRYLAARLR